MKTNLLYRNKLAQRALLGAVLTASCLGASAASFDCTKARSTSERLICGDPKLSALDVRLAGLAADGKKRAASPRAYQRALDAAWLERQKCEDIACVENWYARRIAALSQAQSEPETVATAVQRPAPAQPDAATKRPEPAPARAPAAPPVEARIAVPAPLPPAASAPPRRAAAEPVAVRPSKPNVSPGAQLQVIGEELGFVVPLTRAEFLERYGASGGQCGVSQQLPNLKAKSRSVESDCWTGSECRAPVSGLSCKMLRTGYDGNGRIVLFSTTLRTDEARRTEGARDMRKLVEKFAEFGGGAVQANAAGSGKILSSTGTQGQFRLEAEVTAAEAGQHVGTFSVVSR